MARPLRLERSGGWYHITARGNERKDIFRDDSDRRHFVALLEEMVDRFHLVLHAYVLMANHYHLLVELNDVNLSRAIQWLNVSYSVWFNRRRQRCGHFFQGRFKSVAVDERSWAFALSRYIHLNPVRTGQFDLSKKDRQAMAAGMRTKPDPEKMRKRLSALRRFRWSSYRAYAGLSPVPGWLQTQSVLALGGGSKQKRSARYRKYVEDAIKEGWVASPWGQVREQVVLGSHAFVTKIRQQITGNGARSRRLQQIADGLPSLEAVIRCVEEVKEKTWNEFRDIHGDSGRDWVLYFGRHRCGLTLTQLAEKACMSNQYTVAASVRRMQKKIDAHSAMRAERRQIEKKLNVQTRPQ